MALHIGVAYAETPADRFVASLEQRTSLPADARALISKAWNDCGDDCDGESFLIEGLTLLSPAFRKGLDAYDADDYAAAAKRLHELRSDPDPFIAANATAYEIKSLVQGERLNEALAAIEQSDTGDGGRLSTYSYLAPEIDFLKGYCLLADVQYDKAVEALRFFLSRHPDSSQRLVVSAQQMLLELQNREPDTIGDVADLMTFCGRRLVLADAGDKVKERQHRIVDLLDQMIEEAEQEEKNSSGSSGSGSNSSGGSKPQSPMQESTLPGGAGREGGELQASRRANPADMWGAMPPAERERVMQALRDSFPQQYRRLVEQYYEELAKKP